VNEQTQARKAALSADIAIEALVKITELLDADSDATGVALYNPRSTVAAIRQVLTAADAALTAVRS
jgi:hypothetical protein